MQKTIQGWLLSSPIQASQLLRSMQHEYGPRVPFFNFPNLNHLLQHMLTVNFSVPVACQAFYKLKVDKRGPSKPKHHQTSTCVHHPQPWRIDNKAPPIFPGLETAWSLYVGFLNDDKKTPWSTSETHKSYNCTATSWAPGLCFLWVAPANVVGSTVAKPWLKTIGTHQMISKERQTWSNMWCGCLKRAESWISDFCLPVTFACAWMWAWG